MVELGETLCPGTVLADRWQIEGEIGAGGMATVYAAVDRAGKRVAIKLLHAYLASHPGMCARFTREAQISRLLRHPGLVEIHETGQVDATLFLVMELLEGEDIGARWQRTQGRLSLEVVLPVAWATLDVLSCAHAASIVHRDIKPHNLFITRDGTIKVLDFGLARKRDPDTREGEQTASGVAIGTPAYMAPEQALGRMDLIDGRTDLWALGATMFTLLTGRLLREGSTSEQVVQALGRPVRPLAELAPELPHDVQQVIDRALAAEPKHRWASAREMQIAVQHLIDARSGALTERRMTAIPPTGSDDTLILRPVAESGDITARWPTAPPVEAAHAPRPEAPAAARPQVLFQPFGLIASRPGQDATVSPGDAAALQSDYQLALAAARIDTDLLDALDAIAAALEACPDSTIARYGRGVARQRLEDFEGAIGDYTAALEGDPDLVEARFNRGLARLSLGDRAGARHDLEAAHGALLVRQEVSALAAVRELLEALS